MAAYHIEHFKNKKFFILNDAKSIALLQKWSLLPGLNLSGWAFNQPYQPHKTIDLIRSLLKQASLHDVLLPKVDDGITVEPVPCTLTSMEFFDRLTDPANGVVSRSGDGEIRGCFEEIVDGFILNDELRQLLLNEESDVYTLYSKIERRELLFRLLRHLVFGGQWCQYEDNIQPYIDMVVTLYKDLLNVQKDKDTGDVRIRSKCFQVVLEGRASIQDFIYVLIDPGLREVTLLTHKF